MSKRKTKEKLWLAIRLTHLSLESLGIKRSYDNIIISYKGLVCSSTDALCRNGVKQGMPIATAQLLHNDEDPSPCRIYEREHESENRLLESLCNHFYSYTPHIEVYRVHNPDDIEEISLLLEVSTSIRLFKGIKAIIEKISHTLDKLELSYVCGQGHTKLIAWILSYRQQDSDLAYMREDFIEQVATMEIDYLYAYPDLVAHFKKCGFFFFRDVIHHIDKESLHSLSARFGEDSIQYICDIFDIENSFLQKSIFQKPVATYHPKYIFRESIQFDYPVNNCEQLLHPIQSLLSQLTSQLVMKQAQTQVICWNLYDIYQNKQSFYIKFERLYHEYTFAAELTMIQVENQALPFEVDILELYCEKILPVNFSKLSLIDNQVSQQKKQSLIIVAEKIKARLGEDAMFTLSDRESHIPELSFKKERFENNEQAFSPSNKQTQGDRPSWIFNIPVKIGRRQNELFWRGKLELLQGPERIEGMWWVKPTGRDYFIAKRDDNVRLWIFHDFYKNEWFVHGVFA